MPNIIALIPARFGSKGIKQKNILLFNGKPLLAHSIIYATKSSLISEIIVSTDSKEFANIANEYGARTPFLRPLSLSGDDVQDFPVIEHAVNFLENENNKKIDYVALLRPTSPLRPPNLIEKAYEIIKKNKKGTSVRSVIPTNQHAYRQWFLDDNKIVSPMKNIFEPYNIPRQILPKSYFQSGDIEFIKRDTLNQNSVSGKYVLPLILESKDLFDIDTPKDLESRPK
jgi:CMP-N,N'-diacetyllegionaminic acid synthase|tara:strand:- start:2325 stop:3005 length:681 start_codon:yes stop_codon:yes gene_type:complete